MTTVPLNHEERVCVPAVAVRQPVRGSLALDFKSDVRSGMTFLAASAQEPPLRIIRPFRLEDGSVLVHLHNVSGGVLGGDCLNTSVNVGPRASVQVTSTGATRVYRSRDNWPATTQFNRFTVAENALLEYVPDAIIPFAKARFRQETTINLDAGAGLFWWEILSPGRLARGEVFEYEYVELKTDITVEGRSIVAENVRLQPEVRELSSFARLGPYRYWFTFYIARVGLQTEAWLAGEETLREVVRKFHQPGEALWGISALPSHGLTVRGLSRRGSDILPALRSVWSAAKMLLYGREAIPPRKVN